MRDLGLVVAVYLATAWLHAVIAYAGVRGAIAMRLLARPELRELAWRAVLFAPFATAALQLAASDYIATPRWSLADAASRAGEVIATRVVAPASTMIAGRDAVATTPSAAAPRSPAARDAARAMLPEPSRRGPDAVTSRTTSQALSMPASDDLIAAFAWSWLIVALALAARQLLAARRARRHARALPRLHDVAYVRAAGAIARDIGIAPVDLRRDDTQASPMALAPRHVCVPGWMIATLAPAQRDAMLAHEIAHHARRDPAWRLAQAIAAAVLPCRGATHARRELDDLAEIACDAHAAAHVGHGRPLAECLALCAEHGLHDPSPAFAVAMAHPRSPLIERVRRLLEDRPMSLVSHRARGALFVVVAGAAAVLLPGFTTGALAETPERNSTVEIETEGGSIFNLSLGERTRIRVKRDDYRFNLDADGKFRFNDAETDIESLDGELTLSETRDGVTRAITFERDGDGIVRTYEVDDVKRPLDGAGNAWLADMVAKVYREAGIDAARRVDRIHGQGGADAVLAEIDRIEGDHVAAKYLGLLFAKPGLTSAQVHAAASRIGKLGSDYERRQALVAAFESRRLGADQQATLLAATGAMSSDYERREVLVTAAKTIERDARVHDAWFDALDRGDSDYERREALTAFLSGARGDDATIARALASTRKFDSDYERRVALEAALPLLGTTDATALAYAASTREIDSDYERRTALVALIERRSPSVATSRAILDATDGMSSDYEIGEVLVALAATMPADASLIEAYRGVARRLGDHERGQAERALDRLAAL